MSETKMTNENGNSIVKAAILLTVCVAIFGGYWIFNSFQVDIRSQWLGKRIPPELVCFLEKENLTGEFKLVLVDQATASAKELNALHNKATGINRSQKQDEIRILIVGRHGFPVKSLAEHRSIHKTPHYSIPTDLSFVNQNAAIRNLPRPALIVMKEGEVVDLLVGKEFSEWAF